MRRVSWVRAAEKAFLKFPKAAQDRMRFALEIATTGETADIAKPVKGMGTGVFEIALPFRGDAYRAVYAVQIGEDIWVVDAFQKKSKSGIKTPREDVERIRARLRMLREMLR